MNRLLGLLCLVLVSMLAGCSAPMPGEDVGDAQEALTCSSWPYASDWGGCGPHACANPPSITGIRMGDGVGGNQRQLWIYYNGAWTIGVDMGPSTIGAYFSGAIGGPGKPTLRKLKFTNDTFWDGPGTRITGECVNPTTGVDECLSGSEIVAHGLQVQQAISGPKVCSFGLWTAGLTRVVGLGDTTGDGTVEFRGYNKVGTGPVTYDSCAVTFQNGCT